MPFLENGLYYIHFVAIFVWKVRGPSYNSSMQIKKILTSRQFHEKTSVKTMHFLYLI